MDDKVGNSVPLPRMLTAALVVILVVPSVLLAQQTGGLVEFAGDGLMFEVRYTAAFSEDALTFGELMGYDTVRLPDGGYLDEPGQPWLPTQTVRIALPAGMAVTDVQVVGTESVELAGEYMVFPAQPPRRVSDPAEEDSFVEPDPETYALAEAYPAEPVEFIRQTDLAGVGMAVLEICPVQYVPASKKLMLLTSIEVVLEGTGGYECGDYLPSRISDSGRDAYRQMLAGMVINPEDAELTVSSEPQPLTRGVDPGDYDYVIITQTSWEDDFQPLADWKTKKGMSAKIVDRDWIYNSGGYIGDDHEKIRQFVVDAHDNWGTSYFLLGGDTNVIPYDSRTFPTVDPQSVPNDTYYADYDDDWACEVHVGRAAVQDTSELSTFVSKVLTYEKNPPLSDYAKTVALFGFDLSGPGGGEGEDCKEDIANIFIPPGWTIRKEYDSEAGSHKSDVIGYLNQGNNLVNHIDHSGTTSMGVGGESLYRSDMSNLYNGDRQSTLYTIGCWPCNYPYSTCIGESFVQNSNGGGVGFIGNSRYGWYQPGCDDCSSLRFDRYFFISLLSQGNYRLGVAFSDHKNDTPKTSDTMLYIYTELTLLGDPELPILTQDPQSLTVTHDATLTADVYTTFPVEVYSGGSPVEDATVCLLKEGDVYEVELTDANGIAAFGFIPASTGTMDVTTTGHNYLPDESDAEVIDSLTYFLTVDVTGQGGVTLDPPGETYLPDTTVELTADGDPAWCFDYWEDALSGSDNPDTVLVDDDKTVTAVFAVDCNENNTPDYQDISGGTSEDCNTNGTPDECELEGNDCNSNGTPDECEPDEDCNTNGTQDICELEGNDCNDSGTPDECELEGNDCNDSGTPDECELEGNDCDESGTPDECELEDNDCNNSGTHDACELAPRPVTYASDDLPVSVDPNAPTSFDYTPAPLADGEVTLTFTASADLGGPGEYVDVDISGTFIDSVFVNSGDCSDPPDVAQLFVSAETYNAAISGGPAIINMVASEPVDPNICYGGSYISVTVDYVAQGFDCNTNGTPDECDMDDCLPGDPACDDCNENGMLDECDIADTSSRDTNGNGVPDECEDQCGDVYEGFVLFDDDDDCDVDLNDFFGFQVCFTGPGGEPPSGCACFDGDQDGDVDLGDFLVFQTAFTGPGSGCP